MSPTRLVLIALAAITALALAATLTVIGLTRSSTTTPAGRYPPTSERGAEAENHSLGQLPAIQSAARAFLTGYLAVTYGKPGATVQAITHAATPLKAQLRAQGGRVTPLQRASTPRIADLAVISDTPSTGTATARITDSSRPGYPLILRLQQTPGGWLVVRIGAS